MADTTLKGAIAEAAITAAAVELGIVVLRPLVEGRRYDLVFDVEHRLYRVQCKWAPREAGVVERQPHDLPAHAARVRATRRTTRARSTRVAVYCQELKTCYWLPIDVVAGRRTIHLGWNPPPTTSEPR